MVNSPSRPNLRPADPPPLGASVRHPHSLPHPGIRPRPGRGQFEISNLRLKSPSSRCPSARTIKPQSRQKPQQSRLIVPNQGKRQKTNITIQSANGAAPYQPRATPWVWPPHDTSPERASHPSIKAKNPAIVPHQGKSSLIKANAKFSMIAPIRQPAPGFPPRNSPFATLRLRVSALNPRHQVTINPQSRQKPQQSRLIVPNQGKRQKTNITIQSANGAAPYQPRATP